MPSPTPSPNPVMLDKVKSILEQIIKDKKNKNDNIQ